MTEPIDITTARERREAPARIAVVLPVAGRPGTGALVTGTRARVRRGVRAGAIRLLPLQAGQGWPQRMAA